MSSSKGKVAVITGATGGIGFAVAQRLGKDGYTVVLNGLDNELGAKRVEELSAEGITAEYFGFDVTNEDAVNSNINKIGEKYGKIDVIVNNAGGLGGRSRFEEMTTEFYRNVMALNLDSVFFVSRAAIPFLKKGENATIINYTSNAAWNAGGPGAGIYGTSKAGVQAIDTPFHAQIKATKPEVFASWKDNIMLGRLGQPEDVAGVVSFLASKDASFLTAETIQVGGGQALGI
jgi:NAD(P)-dependent dehydrogenase (short-subunit alcohol dehydrogenase family)